MTMKVVLSGECEESGGPSADVGGSSTKREIGMELGDWGRQCTLLGMDWGLDEPGLHYYEGSLGHERRSGRSRAVRPRTPADRARCWFRNDVRDAAANAL